MDEERNEIEERELIRPPAERGANLPLTILLIALVLWFGFQTVQLASERANLGEARGQLGLREHFLRVVPCPARPANQLLPKYCAPQAASASRRGAPAPSKTRPVTVMRSPLVSPVINRVPRSSP